MKYLVPIDLSQNELQNPQMQNLASAPSSPVAGQFYFNTTTNKAMVYDGTEWVPWEVGTAVYPATATPSMDGTAAVGTSAKYAREDHVHPSDTSRVPTSRTINGKALSSDVTLLGEDITLDSGGSVTVSSALSDLSDALNDKVDKVSGKGLSTNDYTTTEKNKLEGIEAGAQKNPTYTAVTGKPTGNQTPGFGGTFTISQISQAASGQISATDRTVTIPNATATTSAAGLMSSADKSKLNGLPPINVALVTIPVGSKNVSTSGITPGNEIAYTAVSNNEEVIIDKTYANGNIKFSTADNVARAVTIQVTYLNSN